MEVPNLYLVIKKITSLKFNMDTEILLWLCKSLQRKNAAKRLSVQRTRSAVVVSSLGLNAPLQFSVLQGDSNKEK